LGQEIDRCRSMTDQPFAVNVTMLRTVTPPPYAEIFDTIIRHGVRVVETAGNVPAEVLENLIGAGLVVIHKCTSVRHALAAERRGVHIVSIDGFECAGHPGEDDIPGLILIPAAADQVKIPMLASGGFGDGRGLAAALALGAEGINMGTRFCATVEAPIHPNVKQAYVDNDERGTFLIFRSFKNTARVGKSAVSEEVVRRLSVPGAKFSDVQELVAGTAGRELLKTGDLSKGVFWASMVQGLIHDIPTCQVLIDRIIAEAEEIIRGRLASLIV
ncbi:MAG: nitronate monooxygenase, partial [Sphingobium sp.]